MISNVDRQQPSTANRHGGNSHTRFGLPACCWPSGMPFVVGNNCMATDQSLIACRLAMTRKLATPADWQPPQRPIAALRHLRVPSGIFSGWPGEYPAIPRPATTRCQPLEAGFARANGSAPGLPCRLWHPVPRELSHTPQTWRGARNSSRAGEQAIKKQVALAAGLAGRLFPCPCGLFRSGSLTSHPAATAFPIPRICLTESSNQVVLFPEASSNSSTG